MRYAAYLDWRGQCKVFPKTQGMKKHPPPPPDCVVVMTVCPKMILLGLAGYDMNRRLSLR